MVHQLILNKVAKTSQSPKWTNSPKPQDSSFNIINDKEKQQIVVFKELKQANV